MKKTSFILICIFALSLMLNAQSSGSNTGDADLDAVLNEINEEASVDMDKFVSDAADEYNKPVEEIEGLLEDEDMEPADVVMALETSEISKKSLNKVVKTYKSKKSKGWGLIAKKMGIKPGSEKFAQLKEKVKTKNEKIKKDKVDKEKGEDNKGKNDSENKGKSNEDKAKGKNDGDEAKGKSDEKKLDEEKGKKGKK